MDIPNIAGLWSNPDGPLIILQEGRYVRLSDGIGWFEDDGWINALFPGAWSGKVRQTTDPDILLWSDNSTWSRMRDVTGTWTALDGEIYELAQSNDKVRGIGISGTAQRRDVQLHVHGTSFTGELSWDDRRIDWQGGNVWLRTPTATGHWVVRQDQPQVPGLAGTGVKAGTRLELRQDPGGVISTCVDGVDSKFTVNGRLILAELTVTGNFPFGLGLGWLEHTSMSLQWHANRFNRVMDLTGDWMDATNQRRQIMQTTPSPLEWPAVGSFTVDGAAGGTINRNWVHWHGSDGICTLTADTITFADGSRWTRSS